MLRDPERLLKAIARIIDESQGTSDPAALNEVLALGLKQAADEGATSLLPYEVLLIRLTKYVATQVPAELYRDRDQRRQIRSKVADLLVDQGLDPTGARILPRR